MDLSDFDYELPPHLVAQYPTADRADSRLLAVGRGSKADQELQFRDLANLLREGDLLVCNDSKVIRARILAQKSTMGKVEILVERILSDNQVLAQLSANRRPAIFDSLYMKKEKIFKIVGKSEHFYILETPKGVDVEPLIKKYGSVPLPPYIQRDPETLDNKRYQTIFARKPGSIACPTAGLHFTKELRGELMDKGIKFAYVTLHVGAGTFQPIRSKIRYHVMHRELFSIDSKTCNTIEDTRELGGRVIAVGTTTVRVLETIAKQGRLIPQNGETNLFIQPGFRFKLVNAMITNFHLPQSTLLMLVCAFGGHDQVMNAYRKAVEKEYRFFSYGDAMFLERQS